MGELLQQAGIGSVRDEAYWSHVESKPNRLELRDYHRAYFDMMLKNGISPLFVLGYTNPFHLPGQPPTRSPDALEAYVRYCEFLVRSYKGRVRFYEFWNEWDWNFGGKAAPENRATAADYVRLVQAVYPRVKKIDPDAIFLAGACTGGGTWRGWLAEIAKLGVLTYCDGLSAHTYLFNLSDPADRTPEACIRKLHKVEAELRPYNHGRDVPLYITEMGWPTQIARFGTPLETAPSYLARLYLAARTLPFLHGVWWYDFQDDGLGFDDEEHNYGLVRPDLTPKPAYFALADIAPLVASADYRGRIEVEDPGIWILKFQYPDGRDCLAMWSTHLDDFWQIVLRKTSGPLSPLALQRVGSGRIQLPWGTRSWLQDKNPWSYAGNAPLRKNEMEISVMDRPWLMAGDLESVKVVSVNRIPFPRSRRPKASKIHLPRESAFAEMRNGSGTSSDSYRLELGQEKRWVNLYDTQKWKGPADLNAVFGVTWDADALYVQVVVTDDVFSQEYDGEEMWKGDSIQWGIQDLSRISDGWSEFCAALTTKGPRVYKAVRQSIGSPVGLTEAVEARIVRHGNTVTYTLTIPIEEIVNLPLKEGTILGFSLLINDNDGKGRKGWLQWGQGMGKEKNPMEYNWLILTPGAGRSATVANSAGAAGRKRFEYCADVSRWTVGGTNYDVKATKIEAGDEETPTGNPTIKLTYRLEDFPKKLNYCEFLFDPRQAPALPSLKKVSLWIKGNGAMNPLSVRFEDANGRIHQWPLGICDWHGWRKVSCMLKPGVKGYGSWDGRKDVTTLTPPVKFKSLCIDKRWNGTTTSGSMLVGGIVVMSQ